MKFLTRVLRYAEQVGAPETSMHFDHIIPVCMQAQLCDDPLFNSSNPFSTLPKQSAESLKAVLSAAGVSKRNIPEYMVGLLLLHLSSFMRFHLR